METVLLGLAQGIFLVLITVFFRIMQARHATIDNRLKDHDKEISDHEKIISRNSERTAVVETKQTRYDQDIDDIKGLLQHIDEKIETLRG